MLGEVTEVVNAVEADLHEDLARVIIADDVLADVLIERGVDLQQLIIRLSLDLGAGAVVLGNHRRSPLRIIKHRNFTEMTALVKYPHNFGLESVFKLILDDDLTLALGDEVEVVVLRGDGIILETHDTLGSIQDRLHSLHNIPNHILVVDLVLDSFAEQFFSDGVGGDGVLENLDGAEDAVGLGDPLLHEVIQLVLEVAGGVSGDEELSHFSPEVIAQVQSLHSGIHCIHFFLKICVFLIEL
jgi:hypothetical protein